MNKIETKIINKNDVESILSFHGKDGNKYGASVIVVDKHGNMDVNQSKMFHVKDYENPKDAIQAAIHYMKQLGYDANFNDTEEVYPYSENDEDNMKTVLREVRANNDTDGDDIPSRKDSQPLNPQRQDNTSSTENIDDLVDRIVTDNQRKKVEANNDTDGDDVSSRKDSQPLKSEIQENNVIKTLLDKKETIRLGESVTIGSYGEEVGKVLEIKGKLAKIDFGLYFQWVSLIVVRKYKYG